MCSAIMHGALYSAYAMAHCLSVQHIEIAEYNWAGKETTLNVSSPTFCFKGAQNCEFSGILNAFCHGVWPLQVYHTEHSPLLTTCSHQSAYGTHGMNPFQLWRNWEPSVLSPQQILWLSLFYLAGHVT